MTPENKDYIKFLAGTVIVAILGLFLAVVVITLYNRIYKKSAQKDWQYEYNMLYDTLETYRKDKQGRIHTETKTGYVTAGELKLMNRQLYDQIQKEINTSVKNAVSRIHITVTAPASKDSGLTVKDTATGRIDLKTKDDSCATIKAWITPLQDSGFIEYTPKPSEFVVNTYWKDGTWFRPDTLVTDSYRVNGCAEITNQKQVVLHKDGKKPVKSAALIGVGAALMFLLTLAL